MRFDPPLVPAILVRRYKRFLFDAVLDGGRFSTGFCPNTGSMRGLAEPGTPIWVSVHESPTRKYRHMMELVEAAGLPDAYVEVKSVHFMRRPSLVEFPDTVTTRGGRHLEEPGAMAEAVHRAVMLYVVQRADCDRFGLCGDLDPAYAATFARATSRGVEAMALRCRVTPLEIVATDPIPMDETSLAAL